MLLSMLLSGLEREALRVAAGLALSVGIALVFVIATGFALLASAAGLAPPPAVAPSGQPGLVGGAGPSAGVVVVARQYLGMPYVWGGASPGSSFDCSGLVQWSYRQVGVQLPRTAQQQYDATDRVAPAELRPGDLVFFQICCQPPDTVTHVGIYVGGGQMIHAPTEGEVVRVESIDTPFWRGHFAGAGRPAPPPGGGR
jgi:cell wall-associated NlpC family hydrolase